jgi:DNA-3-methyladenine glycosylase II
MQTRRLPRSDLTGCPGLSMNARAEAEIDIEATLTAADPCLGRVIAAVSEKIGRIQLTASHASPFEALLRGIVYQQMASKAAATVYRRLQSLGGGGALAPDHILAAPIDELQKAGLSAAKARYAHHLAVWFHTNPDVARRLPEMPNEEIIKTLTGIPGIGIWTANVFLIFSLKRLDVVPVADLGLRRGVQLAYGLPAPATPAEVAAKAHRWKPYQSIASMYLWNAVKLKLGPDSLRRTATAGQ